MLSKLENEFLSIVSSTFGGELHSIIRKDTGLEYLWNGDEEYWKYHAPVLFPTVGKVRNNTYRVNDKEYKLPQHGLARTLEFSKLYSDETSICYELKFSEESLKIYPFKFNLKIKYTLIKTSIKVEYIVENLDSSEIYFSIGAHPAFMWPLLEGEAKSDYYFEFSEKETASIMQLNSEGYFYRKEISFLKNEKILPLSEEVFKNDALVFHDLRSKEITLKSKNHNNAISVEFSDFPHLGLWSKPTGAPFICIEPWLGHSDYEDFHGEFKDKAGIIRLDVEKNFCCSYTITLY